MNKVCSEYLFKEKIYNNEDVFYLIRFALSGNPVGAPMADIAEVIGKQQVEKRIAAAIEVFKRWTFYYYFGAAEQN